MRYFFLAAIIVVSLLSIVAGTAKVARAPQEVEFFAQAGLGNVPLVVLGVVQVVGGALSFFQRYKQAGLSIVTLGFLLSVVVISLTGDFGFAAISMLPAILSGGLAVRVGSR